jgi:pimeloyl-ACP methyl ester carboxylesterase
MNKSISHLNRTFFYDVSGNSASVIVFLHGFLGCKEIWQSYIQLLKNDHTIITIDLPGHGQSEVLNDATTMLEMAEIVYAICKKEKVTTCHMVGHSMGGYVTLALDTLYPEFLKSITLMNSTANEDSEQKKKDRVLAARVFDLNPSVFILEAVRNLFYAPNLILFKDDVTALISLAQQTPAKGAQASLLGMKQRFETVKHLRLSQKKVHYISGKQDNTVLFHTIEEQLIGMNATLTAFENCGHMAFVEKHSETLKAMIKFWEINR